MFHRQNEKHLGRGMLEGMVLTQPHTKITAYSARLATEYVGKVTAYYCRVYQSDSHLIIRWRYVLTLPIRKILLQNSAIERYFIFVNDPRLVVLAVSVQCSQRCAYILIRMKNNELALGICGSIEERRAACYDRTFLVELYPSSLGNYSTTPREEKPAVQEYKEPKSRKSLPVFSDKRLRNQTCTKGHTLGSYSHRFSRSDYNIQLSPQIKKGINHEEMNPKQLAFVSTSKSISNFVNFEKSEQIYLTAELSVNRLPASEIESESLARTEILQQSERENVTKSLFLQTCRRDTTIQQRNECAGEDQTCGSTRSEERSKKGEEKEKWETSIASENNQLDEKTRHNLNTEGSDIQSKISDEELNETRRTIPKTKTIEDLRREIFNGLDEEDIALLAGVIENRS